jgi:hypothetical protein
VCVCECVCVRVHMCSTVRYFKHCLTFTATLTVHFYNDYFIFLLPNKHGMRGYSSPHFPDLDIGAIAEHMFVWSFLANDTYPSESRMRVMPQGHVVDDRDAYMSEMAREQTKPWHTQRLDGLSKNDIG